MTALASSITRRTVLGMFSVAGVLFTSGCSGAIVSAPAKPALAENPSAAESTTPESDETAPPSASPTSAAKDYSGEAKLEKYDTSAGPYEPATKEHPAKNVPKPVVPEHMYEDSVAGMHATIAYYAACLTYLNITGDPSPIRALKWPNESYKSFEKMGAETKNGTLWYANPSFKIVLITPQPTREGSQYRWPLRIVNDLGSFAVKDGKYTELSPQDQHYDKEVIGLVNYQQGRWEFRWEGDEDDDPSPSVSPRASQ